MKATLSALFAGLFMISAASAFAATTANDLQGNIVVAEDTTAQPADQSQGSDQGSSSDQGSTSDQKSD